MALIIKPAPIQIGDRYVYTLSSYDPVEVSVGVPLVTEDDVQLAFIELVMRAGGNPRTVDDAWVAQSFDGPKTVGELREFTRQQLEAMNAFRAEQAKADQCALALAERLNQSIPAAELARSRSVVRATMERDLAASGMDLAGFAAASGMPAAALEASIDSEAQALAEREAALDAFISERKVTVDEEEYPALLGLSPAQTGQMLEEARGAGRLEHVRRAALHAKALGIVVQECSCSYEVETAEQAQRRVEAYRAAALEMRERMAQDGQSQDDGPKLKLMP